MNKENPLTRKLQERIRAAGAVTFHDWMDAALYEPHQGYYCTSGLTRWGRGGDYRTSPERSQLFAATFARYFANLHEKLERPREWTILEVGAGAGDFAYGILDSFQRRSPELQRATTYLIDERSEDSCRLLRERLKSFENQVRYVKLDSIDPINSGIIFANELLDAFPVHRLSRRGGEVQEFYVTLGESGEFEWQLGPLSSPRLGEYLKWNDLELADNQIVEINLEIENWLRLAASKLEKGYLILADYGKEAAKLYNAHTRPEGTLRSFHRHQFAENILANPGQQDLTTTIDWTLVKTTAKELGFKVAEFDAQDKFLMKAGILDELQSLTSDFESEAERLRMRTQAREMILPMGMAESFEVMVLSKSI